MVKLHSAAQECPKIVNNGVQPGLTRTWTERDSRVSPLDDRNPGHGTIAQHPGRGISGRGSGPPPGHPLARLIVS
jgi:hypothetical protein